MGRLYFQQKLSITVGCQTYWKSTNFLHTLKVCECSWYIFYACKCKIQKQTFEKLYNYNKFMLQSCKSHWFLQKCSNFHLWTFIVLQLQEYKLCSIAAAIPYAFSFHKFLMCLCGNKLWSFKKANISQLECFLFLLRPTSFY